MNTQYFNKAPHNTGSVSYPATAPSVSFFEVAALGLVVALCVAVRVFHLGAASLWTDEIFSRYYAELFGFHYLVTTGLSTEATPPTYPLLLRGWIALWGGSEAALRSLSVLACAACVPVVHALGRELGGRRQGLLGALLFALCPMSLYFAQEARVYALLILATAIVLWAAAVFQRDPRSTKAVLTYLIGGTLCLYLHATAILFMAACGGAVWFALLAQGANGRRALLRWTALNAIVLALGLPYLIHIATAGQNGGLDWVPPLSLHEIGTSASAVASGLLTPYPWPAFPLAVALMASLAASVYWGRPAARAIVTLVIVPSLFVGLVVAASLVRPILLPRVLAWTTVPLCTALAGQLVMTGRLRVAALATVTAAFGIGLAFQMTSLDSGKEPWREALRELAPELGQADLVVISPLFDPMVLTYYAPHARNVRLWDASLRPTIMTAAAERMHIPTISRNEILQSIKAGRFVWVLANSLDTHHLVELRAAVPAATVREWRCGAWPCIEVAGWGPGRRSQAVNAVVFPSQADAMEGGLTDVSHTARSAQAAGLNRLFDTGVP